MRSTPQLPLATPEADPEKIIRRRKTPQEGTSIVEPGDSGNFQKPSLETLEVASHSPIIPSVGVSRNLNFGIFPVVFTPPSLGLESFDTPVSHEVAQWSRPRTLEDFPTLSFITPPPIKIATFTEG
jgi:hypothetical protein